LKSKKEVSGGYGVSGLKNSVSRAMKIAMIFAQKRKFKA